MTWRDDLCVDFFHCSLNVLPSLIFLSQSRQELEQHSVDTASTSDAVNFITYVQTLKRKIKQFEKNVDVSSHYEQNFAIIGFLFNHCRPYKKS